MAARGRPPGSLDKPFRDALRIAVKEASGDGNRRKLRAIADALVDKAITGDIPAIKEVAERLDGRAPQDLTVRADASEAFLEALRAVSEGRVIGEVDKPVADVENVAPEVRH